VLAPGLVVEEIAVGRGTSTFDGLALAWAIAEHLHDAVSARTLFASHYHELCEPGSSVRSVAICMAHARGAQGFGRKRWSRRWLVAELGLFEWSGERSAGNPPAPFGRAVTETGPR
jgi:hypothetical protein